jgi:hypothetical protein
MTTHKLRAEHNMVRLDIPTGIAFDEFRARFERAAPAFDAGSAADGR